MYKLIKDPTTNIACKNIVWRLSDQAYIPFDQANTDYQNFKAQINDGEAGLQDADGNLMTPEQTKEYVKEIP